MTLALANDKVYITLASAFVIPIKSNLIHDSMIRKRHTYGLQTNP